MQRSNALYQVIKRASAVTICIVEMGILMTGVTACGVKNSNTVTPQEAGGVSGIQQDISSSVQTKQSRQTPAKQSADGQIGLEEAKQAALADAGVSDSDVVYTKEKMDYEDGVAVYDVEFYVDNTEYEYEINAVTGEVYSKSVEKSQMQNKNVHDSQPGTSDDYIGEESAKSVALDHAGFSEADVSRVKTQFDIDDGLAEYEVEFYKDGREYEYKINAADGSILEYDVD